MPGQCKLPGTDVCPTEAVVRLEAALCQTISGCAEGSPTLVTAENGNPAARPWSARPASALPSRPTASRV